jgi:hypothetical protein
MNFLHKVKSFGARLLTSCNLTLMMAVGKIFKLTPSNSEFVRINTIKIRRCTRLRYFLELP